MTKVKRFARRWWWAFLLAAAVVGFVLWKILGPRPADPELAVEPPKFLEMARKEVERVHLEGEVEKAKVRATADSQREAIADIEETAKDDPAEARKELAAFLAQNL